MSKTRLQNRLKNKTLYSTSNYFFITICSKDRECIFGEAVVGEKFISPFIERGVEQGELKFAPTVQYLIKTHNTIWQKSFYDHIIRDDRDMYRIQEYILHNSLKWNLDILNPKNSKRYKEWVKRKMR